MENKTRMADTTQPENTTQFNRFNKQLGNIIYEVSVNFKQGATETLDKKILRLIKNEMGRCNGWKCPKCPKPQQKF